MFDVLTERLGRYFRHEDPDHDVLERGDRAVACRNIRRAIQLLDIDVEDPGSDDQLFDAGLESGVKRAQAELRHGAVDGTVGPGTRRLLVWTLLLRHPPTIFARFKRPQPGLTAFLSYSSKDATRVDELEQWLKHSDVRVIRYTTDFTAGATISDNIRTAVAQADKVVVVHSADSDKRDWVRLERAFAEEVERGLGPSTPKVLIYLCLDDTPLPEHDCTRVAILAKGRQIAEYGDDLLRALKNRGP
jgi:hypothetical protein